MFEYFSDISGELGKRYDTLLMDLRSGSNSFFASYRALVECFVKTVVSDSPYKESHREKTLMHIISSTEISEYMRETVGIPQTAHQKVKNYILKINKQLHDREKEFDDEFAKSYLFALYDFTAPYAHYLGINTTPVTEVDILDAFMADSEAYAQALATGAENSEAILEGIGHIDVQMSELRDNIKSLSNTRAAESNAPQDSSETERLIDDIRKLSDLYNVYFGSRNDYLRQKICCILLSFFIIAAGALNTYVSFKAHEFYSPFAIPENLWHITVIFFMFKLIRTSYAMPHAKAFFIMPVEFGPLFPKKISKKYRIIMRFVVTSLVFHLIIFEYENLTRLPYIRWYIVISLAIIIASYALLHAARRMYLEYFALAHRLTAPHSKSFVLFEVPALDKYFSEEEYTKNIYGGKKIRYPK